ncbi:MAG: asparagine--tRNA ligase [Actinobacteria bacterium]|nr:asparagine--tRNA ligase [Actinomycetota bacterium]
MPKAYIENIANFVDQEVTLQGWLYNKRSSGKIQFLLVRDGSGMIQCVVSRADVSPDAWQAGEALTQESSLEVSGRVRADKRAPGGYELTATDLKVVQIAEEYPITPKEHGVDFLMNNRHLWLRSRRQHAALRVRAEIIRALQEFYDSNGFVRVDTPILTPAACEGTTTLFETDYFGEPAYLSQSGQLYNEATMMAFGRVYCYGPTFRAEKSKTRRHLMEFWMIEPEIAYADLDECMRWEEESVAYVVRRVLQTRAAELEVLERDTSRLQKVAVPFPRISYDEALEILKKAGEEIPWGEDFGGGHETIISEDFEKPVFIHGYPTKAKAFYMQPDPQRPEVTLSVDLIAPEGYGEIIGGGQRIHDLNLLEQRLEEYNLPREPYEWYLDLRRYGSVPHSGYGQGIERTVAWICGLEHVRETIPFPRLLYRMYP